MSIASKSQHQQQVLSQLGITRWMRRHENVASHDSIVPHNTYNGTMSDTVVTEVGNAEPESNRVEQQTPKHTNISTHQSNIVPEKNTENLISQEKVDVVNDEEHTTEIVAAEQQDVVAEANVSHHSEANTSTPNISKQSVVRATETDTDTEKSVTTNRVAQQTPCDAFQLTAFLYKHYILLVDDTVIHSEKPNVQNLWTDILNALTREIQKKQCTTYAFEFPVLEQANQTLVNAQSAVAGWLHAMLEEIVKENPNQAMINVGLISAAADSQLNEVTASLPSLFEKIQLSVQYQPLPNIETMLIDWQQKKKLWQLLNETITSVT